MAWRCALESSSCRTRLPLVIMLAYHHARKTPLAVIKRKLHALRISDDEACRTAAYRSNLGCSISRLSPDCDVNRYLDWTDNPVSMYRLHHWGSPKGG